MKAGGGATAREALVYLIADEVGAVGGLAVGHLLQETLLFELLVGGGELLLDLGGIFVRAQRDPIPERVQFHLPAPLGVALFVDEPVEAFGHG